jgi:hypothetical protein
MNLGGPAPIAREAGSDADRTVAVAPAYDVSFEACGKDHWETGMRVTMTDRTGGCACGAIRFKITAPLVSVGVCHCTDCQKASGGGPNYVALAPKTAFEITKGEARVYFSKGDSGEDAGRAFCPNCGTPLWSLPAHAPFTTVKLGALDHNSDLTPALHLYTGSAAPWHLMHEGVPTFPKMPPFPPPGA